MVYYIFMNSHQTQIYRGMRRIRGGERIVIAFLGYFHVSKSLVKTRRKDRYFLIPPLQFRFGRSIRRESILWTWGCLEIHYRLRREYAYSYVPQGDLCKTCSAFLFSHALKYWRKIKGIFSSELKKTFFSSCLTEPTVWNHYLNYRPA